MIPPADRDLSKLDPYLRLAQGEGWQDYFAARPAADTLFDVILELADGGAAVQALRELADGEANLFLNTAHLDAGSSFVTARLGAAAIQRLEAQAFVRRIACAQVLLPRRPTTVSEQAPRALAMAAARGGAGPAADQPAGAARVLAASIDHGCPFAHREFQDAAGATRIVTLWDQDPAPEFAAALAGPPAGFLDGREISAQQLQAWVDGAAGDEASCYRRAGYSAVGGAVTHGSHLLGRFAGRSWGAGAQDAAAQAGLAFVQLPRRLLQTPSEGAVHRCILDGLRYLRRYAREHGYDRCVVVCAYGSYLGPHDGSSLFERALDAFLEEEGPRFHIVFPAGNCCDQGLHVVLEPQQQTTTLVEWNLPSDNETSTYAEFWLPEGPAGEEVEVFVRHGGAEIPIDAAAGGLPHWLSAVRQQQPDGQTQIVVRAAMTAAAGPGLQTAPAGKVVFGLRTHRAPAQALHGYLCWGGENIGFPRRMQQAWWTVPAGSSARLAGDGTLMGSACGRHPEIYVAGGYIGHNVAELRQRASYSSVGPSRGAHRAGPTVLALAQESFATRGIPGPGTLSGSIEYLWGTSVAVPLVARKLLNGEDLRASSRNPRGEPTHEVGLGYLD